MKRTGCLTAVLMACGFALALSSCATGKKSASQTEGALPSGGEAAPMGPPEPYGPLPPDPATTYGPDPMTVKPIVLVLGPGLARGFAFVGALRVFSEQKIPIGAVLGTEMGSLIGALYAMNGNMNSLDWGLLRLREKVFLRKDLFKGFSEGSGDGGQLEGELIRIFGHKDLSESKLPLRIALHPKKNPLPVVLYKGPLRQALRAALAVPGFLTPGKWESDEAVSAGSARPYLVSEAKALDIGPVIVLDVLANGAHGDRPSLERGVAEVDSQMSLAGKVSLDEVKDADLVIRPDLNGIGYLDFDKRAQAEFRGKLAVTGRIGEIKRLIGIQRGGTK